MVGFNVELNMCFVQLGVYICYVCCCDRARPCHQNAATTEVLYRSHQT